MPRHERQTVAMKVAAAMHQSRDGEPDVTYEAPQRHSATDSRKTPPGVLQDPVPQLVLAFLRSLVGLRRPTTLNASALSFRLRSSLEEKNEAEEKADRPADAPRCSQSERERGLGFCKVALTPETRHGVLSAAKREDVEDCLLVSRRGQSSPLPAEAPRSAHDVASDNLLICTRATRLL